MKETVEETVWTEDLNSIAEFGESFFKDQEMKSSDDVTEFNMDISSTKLHEMSDVYAKSLVDGSSFDDFVAMIRRDYEITAVHLLNKEFSGDCSDGEIVVKMSLKNLYVNPPALTEQEPEILPIPKRIQILSNPSAVRPRVMFLKRVKAEVPSSYTFTVGESDTFEEVVCENSWSSALENANSSNHSNIILQQLGLQTCVSTLATQEPEPIAYEIANGEDLLGMYLCNVCGKSYKQESALIRHNLAQHCAEKPAPPVEPNKDGKDNATYKCHSCARTFKEHHSLVRHKYINCYNRKRTQEGEMKPVSYLCDNCGKSFSNRTKLLQHQYSEHNLAIGENSGQLPHECMLCDATFNDRHRLRWHLLTHQGHKYQCRLCPMDPFDGYRSYRNHLANVHRMIKCKKCGLPCYGRNGFKEHIKTAHPDDKRPDLLLYDKKFHCAKCKAEFRTNCDLKKHDMNKHLGVRFDCSQCGKKLTTEYGLKLHMRLHGVNAQHNCEECQRVFSQKGHLIQHLRSTHPERVPQEYYTVFKCLDCNKDFARKESLEKHQLAKHEGVNLSCPTCLKRVRTRSAFNKHIKNCFVLE